MDRMEGRENLYLPSGPTHTRDHFPAPAQAQQQQGHNLRDHHHYR